MVVVPALTHCQERRETHVVPLNGCSADFVPHASVIVREISDEPVSEYTGRYARADAPEHEAPAATPIKDERPGQMLEHPGSFQKAVETVIQNSCLDPNLGWCVEHEFAIELPPGIAPRAAAMSEVFVAARQPLRKVP